MARRRDGEGAPVRDGAPSPDPFVDDVVELRPPPPKRAVAFCKQSRAVVLDGQHIRVLGGEFITHPPHVEAVRSDDGFRILEVDDEELAELMDAHAREVEHLRERAAELGFVVYRDGEQPPRPRR